jgi:ElaB/YqjD/DUF883 family membrane-anchored ribosome-binding protein
MPETVLERANTHAAEAIHAMSHTTAAVADVFDEGMDMAKHIGKRASDATEELMDDTQHRIQRHPAESLVAAFAFGFILGGLLDCLLRRR